MQTAMTELHVNASWAANKPNSVLCPISSANLALSLGLVTQSLQAISWLFSLTVTCKTHLK